MLQEETFPLPLALGKQCKDFWCTLPLLYLEMTGFLPSLLQCCGSGFNLQMAGLMPSLWQCCGSGFIESGSRSSISIEFDPGFWWTKTWKRKTYGTAEKNYFLKIKNYHLLNPRPPWRTPKLQQKPSTLKREHTALPKMKFINFLWVIFALPDPQYWFSAVAGWLAGGSSATDRHRKLVFRFSIGFSSDPDSVFTSVRDPRI